MRSKAVITKMWKKVFFYCSEHPDEQLELYTKGKAVIYKCHHENCKNAITINEAESAIQKIIDMIANAEFNNESTCLTNYKWTKNGIKYTITEHDMANDVVKVEVQNKKSLTNTLK